MTHETNLPAVQSARPQRIEVMAPAGIMDTGRFEHMQRVASLMARCLMIPDHLHSVVKQEGSRKVLEPLPFETVMANCFMVVCFADRFNMDPFLVAQAVSIVHGRMCFEGKLIHALIETKLGIRLIYTWNDKTGDNLGIVVSGQYPDEPAPREIEGTVGKWKTTGNGSPWGRDGRKQLAYRGAREWARLHAPGIMLGLYSPDEMEDLRQDVAARRAVPLQERLKLAAADASASGFSAVARATEKAAEAAAQVEAPQDAEEAEPAVDEAPSEDGDATEPETEDASEEADDGEAEPEPVAYTSEEQKTYDEGFATQRNGKSPSVPARLRHANLKHLADAWTQGFMDAVNEPEQQADMLEKGAT